MEHLMEKVIKEDYIRAGYKTTICVLTLYNGMEVTGTSMCQDPNDYNEEAEQQEAREKALHQVYNYLLFLTQEEKWRHYIEEEGYFFGGGAGE